MLLDYLKVDKGKLYKYIRYSDKWGENMNKILEHGLEVILIASAFSIGCSKEAPEKVSRIVRTKEPVYLTVPEDIHTRFQVYQLLKDEIDIPRKAYYDSLKAWNNGKIDYNKGDKIKVGTKITEKKVPY